MPRARRMTVLLGAVFACWLLLCPGAGPARAVEDLVLAGADALYRGDAAGAQRALAEAVARDPDDDFAVNQLGLALALQERFGEARARFAAVALRSPDNLFAQTWLGVLDLREDDADAARERFRLVLDVDPENPMALYLLGVEAATRRDLGAAVDFFARAGRSGRDDPEVQYRLAEAYRGLDMPENARLCYERVLASDPLRADALVGLGWTLYGRGERDAAVLSWERALAVSPEDAEARAGLAFVLVREGVALAGAGRAQEARARFARALFYEPGNKAASYYLRRMPASE